MSMILKKGDKGADVKTWQAFLVAQGYHIAADGDFGPATEASTKGFQTIHALRPDGIVGDNTIAAAKLVGFAGFPSTEEPNSATPTDSDPHGLLAHVHPKLATAVKKIVQLAAGQNFILQVTQGLRTYAEQDALYNQGRTRKGPKVTDARGGQSWHNFGLAVDIAFITHGEIDWTDALYSHIGTWAAQASIHWAGLWNHPDLPHVQLPVAKSPDDNIRAIYKRAGLQGVWQLF
jgi:peptidoglycan L-alanyl-D-glutamate endopeptidase CwlK